MQPTPEPGTPVTIPSPAAIYARLGELAREQHVLRRLLKLAVSAQQAEEQARANLAAQSTPEAARASS